MRRLSAMLGAAAMLGCAVGGAYAQVEKAGPEVGDASPEFSATTDAGETWASSDRVGSKAVVVYFYPAAMTPGCTRQACAYRDDLGALNELGVEVVGVSGDEPEGLELFKQAHGLNFALLSDADGAIARAFGVPLRDGGSIEREVEGVAHTLSRGVTAARWTFVIGRSGKIVYKNASVNAGEDSAAILAAVADLDESERGEPGPPVVGQKVKDFELNTPGGEAVSLAKLNEQGPVVLIVLRGWPGYQCPICSRQLGAFAGKASRFAELGASVLLVYPGPESQLAVKADEFLGDRSLPEGFHYVIDPNYEFTNLYHLRWDAPRETAYPSTFVLDEEGVVRFAKVSHSHGGRSSADEVLEAVRSLGEQPAE